MNRRAFLASLTAGALSGCRPPLRMPGLEIMTVTGPVPASTLGTTLPHEHVLVDFAPIEEGGPHRYDGFKVYGTVLPYLKQVRALGCETLFECTPAFLGRDPTLLRSLSNESGLLLVTNTGYYGARNDQHLPPHTFSDTVDQLATRWMADFRGGIDGTGVRPGFMKIGVDPGALSDIDRKLIRAAARAHLQTGLTIASHTGPAAGAFEQLAVLEEESVHASAWVWVHAQGEEDGSAHVRAAQAGAWVSFDGVSPNSLERHVELVTNMKTHDLLHRVLVSHDAGWYHVGEPDGGTFRPFDTMFTSFLPALKQAGLSDADIHQLTVTNPAEAYALRVRAR